MSAASRKFDDDLFADAADASSIVEFAREETKREALEAIRLLERRIKDAVRGDVIRGLSALVREGTPFFAARIGSKSIDDPLPYNGRQVLVFSKTGGLWWASRVTTPQVCEQRWIAHEAADETLRTEHLEQALTTADEMLRRHIDRAEKTAANYERIAQIHDRVMRLLT
jgi:hypothetical protein